jgi:hypothetical protein
MRARRLDADCAVVVRLECPLRERVTRRGRGVSPASATIVAAPSLTNARPISVQAV